MALRKVAPVGPQNTKTYPVEAPVLRGYGVAAGAAEGNCTPVVAAGGRGIGLATEAQPTVGGALGVCRFGDCVAIAGAPATMGQYAKFNAAGQVIPVTGTAGDGEEVIGRFESSPIEAGDECIVYVSPFVL